LTDVATASMLRREGSMRSILRRSSDSSSTRWMRSGRPFSPFVPSIVTPSLVATATLSRTGARASPTSASLT
jgi:hypothetical protein